MNGSVVPLSVVNDAPKNFYDFDRFRVDVMRHLLLHEGVPVRLTPKAFDTLLVLIRSGGRIMSKAELMSAIWPDSYVDESNLAQNIFLLRRALGEAKNEHRYIVTIPGSGYRFVSRVVESTLVACESPPVKEQKIDSNVVLPFEPLCDNHEFASLLLSLVSLSVSERREICMMKRTVETKNAPAPIGPYSQAIIAGDHVFASGQTPINPETGELVEGDISEQTAQALRNLSAVLEAAGSNLGRVLKTTVYLADMNDFAAMNEAYARFFNHEPPARTTIQAARLPRDARVEIELIALAGNSSETPI